MRAGAWLTGDYRGGVVASCRTTCVCVRARNRKFLYYPAAACTAAAAAATTTTATTITTRACCRYGPAGATRHLFDAVACPGMADVTANGTLAPWPSAAQILQRFAEELAAAE